MLRISGNTLRPRSRATDRTKISWNQNLIFDMNADVNILSQLFIELEKGLNVAILQCINTFIDKHTIVSINLRRQAKGV